MTRTGPVDQQGPREMPLGDIMEMLADWTAMSMAQGQPDARAWYRKQRLDHRIILAPLTAHHADVVMGFPPYTY